MYLVDNKIQIKCFKALTLFSDSSQFFWKYKMHAMRLISLRLKWTYERLYLFQPLTTASLLCEKELTEKQDLDLKVSTIFTGMLLPSLPSLF